MANFIANESSEDNFVLTASDPWHIDPNNYILLQQPTTVVAFLAAQFSGVRFWALDSTNAQRMVNDQSFQGYVLNPNDNVGLLTANLPAGQWWMGVTASNLS